MKTILIPTEDHDSMPAVLEAARLIARTFDSYMEGFAVRPYGNEQDEAAMSSGVAGH